MSELGEVKSHDAPRCGALAVEADFQQDIVGVQSVHVWMSRRLFISGGHTLFDFAPSLQENVGYVIFHS